ncbi:MAG: hypothetical protein Q9M43_02055 [Sulfurimonas sp.]|nr:hypothetical protein [Sulfurimonas sp.]
MRVLEYLMPLDADVEWEHIEVGEKVYLAGNTSGIVERSLGFN